MFGEEKILFDKEAIKRRLLLLLNQNRLQGGKNMDVNSIISSKIDSIAQSKIARVKNSENIASERINSGNDIKLTKNNIDNLVDTLNLAAKTVNERVSFRFHEKTNRVIMKFTDSKTNEVIREIPPKEMIRLLEHMHELIGMFVDESR